MATDDVLLIAEASERFHALTDLRQRYALADRTRSRLQLVMDSSIAFSSASTEERLAEILADTTARAYRAETSTVYLLRPDGIVCGRRRLRRARWSLRRGVASQVGERTKAGSRRSSTLQTASV